MKVYNAPFYTESALEELSEEQVHFPFSDKDATYDGLFHQYQLTEKYFAARGVSLHEKIEGSDPEKVKHFLKELSNKVYTFIYTHNQSTRRQMNYMIARGRLRGYSPYEFRQAFLEAMFKEGEYLLENGDISMTAGVDYDTMQNMSADVVRNQDRDMHKDCVRMLTTLGLFYLGRYCFIPQGEDW